MIPTIDTGSLPFRIADQLGRTPEELPGRWRPFWTAGAVEGQAPWRVYRAWASDGRRRYGVFAVANVRGGTVRRVALDVPGAIIGIRTTNSGTPYLVAIPRPLGHSELNWIHRAPSGRLINSLE